MLTMSNRALLGYWPKTYAAQMKKFKKPVIIEDIPGTKIQGTWFGDKERASTILIWYHGGGFAMSGMDMHAVMLNRWDEWCDGKLAIFMPGYTTTPTGVYPQALAESVEATRYVLDGAGKNKEVIIGGDSAGGQLCIAVLSHVSGHPHPQSDKVKPLDLKGKKLKGAIALAPWVSSDANKFPSMRENEPTDMITCYVAGYWSELWKAGHPDDEYIVPEIAPPGWWSGVKNVTDNVIILAGDDEVLRDPIVSWAKKFEEGSGVANVRLVVAPGESHDEPMQPKAEELMRKEVEGKEKTQEGAILLFLKKLTA
jgi:acetyl esterase/lipase